MLIQLLLLLLLFSVKALDICHSDPRVKVLHRTCHPPRNALHIPRLGRNPFHALHDIIWAFSHYMVHCAPKELTVYLNERQVNLSACEDYSADREAIWGACLIYFMAQHWNVPLILRETSWPKGWPPEPPEKCYARNVFLGALEQPVEAIRVSQWHFRNLNWFSTVCTNGKCDYIPLSEELKEEALRHIRFVIRNKFPSNQTRGDIVNVLLYDRADTRRRQWSNSRKVYELMKKDPRVKINLIHEMPESFPAQVRLFNSQEIVIAPHGAAMANTIFMREGSEVIEIWKYCLMDVAADRKLPRDWTGWHSRQVGLGLTYVQCHVKEHGIRQRFELFKQKTGGLTEGEQIVRIAEILDVFNEAVTRVQMKKRVNKRLTRSSVIGYTYLLASSYFLIALFALCSLYKLGARGERSMLHKFRNK